MDQLKGLNLRSLLRFIDSQTEEEFISWLQSVGLLHSNRKCPSCNKLIKIRKRDDLSSVKLQWRCSNSRKCVKRPTLGFFNGTFFEEHRLALKEIFLFSYFWVHGISDDKTIEREFRRDNDSTISPNTRTLYRKLFSETCLEYFIRTPQRIGGTNIVVEVDKSLIISRRKYNVGRIPVDMQTKYKQWYFGGVVRGDSTNCFIIPIPDQKAVTLCSDIDRYILPGSIVIHDGHASYQSIDRMKESHEHYEVLHKYNFVSPDNPDIHTQTIESTWQKFKQANRRRGGTSRALFMQFLSEYLWKKNFGGSDALYYLWKQISEMFVCIDGEIVIRKVFDSDWNYDVFDD